jgi:hypothetical protein
MKESASNNGRHSELTIALQIATIPPALPISTVVPSLVVVSCTGGTS